MRKNIRKNSGAVLQNANSAGLTQKTSIPAVIFGMFCRFAVAFAGALGIALMLDDAFTFVSGTFDPVAVMLTCAVFCAFFFTLLTAANTNRVFFYVLLAAGLGAAVFFVIRYGRSELFISTPAAVWNHIIGKLSGYGYASLGSFAVTVPEASPVLHTNAERVYTAYLILCAFISFIFVSCTFKKVRVIPVIVISGVVMTVTFTYNILHENFGFLLVVSSGFGILVLKYYELFIKNGRTPSKTDAVYKSVYAKRRADLKDAAVPGLSAFIAAAVVFGVGAYPASVIKRPSPELTVFSELMSSARDIVYLYITGGSAGDVNSGLNLSTAPDKREFNDVTVMTVSSEAAPTLYLRHWVGDSYANNEWIAAKERSYSDFVPEQVTELFYKIVDDTENDISSQSNHSQRGTYTEHITVKSRRVSGKLMSMPSRYSTEYGIKSVDGSDYNSGYTAGSFTGMVYSGMKNAEYSVVSFVPNYSGISSSKIDADMRIYGIIRPFLKNYIERKLGMKTTDAEISIDDVYNGITELGVNVPSGCILAALDDMDAKELTELYTAMENAEEYESYVYDTCLSVPWRDETIIRSEAYQAVNMTNGVPVEYSPSDVYAIARQIAGYLARKTEYTLSPHGYSDTRSYVSQFLTTARNGYCVQYATAGALMLRSLGIPARLVEGYIADVEYTRDGAYGMYTCDVKDHNSHAWVEAYIKGYGWITLEMTAPMLGSFYPTSSNIEPPDTEPPQTQPAETTGDDTTGPIQDPQSTTAPEAETDPVSTHVEVDPPAAATDPRTVVSIAVSVIAAVLLLSAVYVYLRYTQKRKAALQSLIQKAADGDSDTPEKDVAELSERIFFLFRLIGIRRGENELMSDFVKRADDAAGNGLSFEDAAQALQKQSYGHFADKADAASVAVYAADLGDTVKDRMRGIKRFYYVKLRKLL